MSAISNLLSKLDPVKSGDSVFEVASSDRMNAIQELLKMLVRGENIVSGPNVFKKSQDGFVSLSAHPVVRGGGGGGGSTPFLVYQDVDNSVPPYPILKVYPGKIMGLVPTLKSDGTYGTGGAPLDAAEDAVVQPWLYTPGNDFSIYLRVQVTQGAPPLSVQYRSSITDVQAVTSEDPTAVIDRANFTQEFQIVWEGVNQAAKDLKTTGHFYINVADVKGSIVGGNILIGEITQWLFTSITSFVIAGDFAVVLV